MIRIVMTDSRGEKSKTQQLCCISSYVHTLYLSREDLGSTVSKEFTNKNTATCPEYSLPPPPPTILPHTPTMEYILFGWI